MKRKPIVLKFLLIAMLLGSLGINALPNDNLFTKDKKFERLKSKADRNYEGFSYDKAIDQYKEALQIKLDPEVKLQLANCYRLLNDPKEAAHWYELALNDNALSPQDMLNYGQVLSAAGRYDESLEIFEKYQNLEGWVDGKIEGLKDVEQFYQNQEAFSIQESIFNSEQKDFSPSFYNEGIYFVTGRPSAGLMKPEYNWDGGNFLDLFEVKEGTAPTKVHRGVNTRYHEGPAALFDNDEKMIFTRNNYNKKKANKSIEGVNMLKLYYTERRSEEKWKKAKEVPFNSDDYSVGHPSMTSDGKIMYFASDMPGGFGGVDLYKVSYDNGKWGTPVNMGERFNTEEDEMFPFIHNDSLLYFSSHGHEGLGGLDLFRADLYDNREPRNLGFPLNTNGDDFGITLKDGTNKGYFSSNREGGTGDDDIYEVIIFDYIIVVTLVDGNTRQPIIGDMDAYELILPTESDTLASVRDGSRVVFKALRGSKFDVGGISPDYVADTLNITTADKSRDVFRLDFELPLYPAKGGEAEILVVINNDINTQLMYIMDSTFYAFDGELTGLKEFLEEENLELVKETFLRNIFYDFDKYNIREDAAIELDKIIGYLNEVKEIKINLSAHTDKRGSNAYNERLAKNRVESAKRYLINKGIDSGRITTESHGEEKKFDSCDNCNEIQHQSNRRTEIRIITDK